MQEVFAQLQAEGYSVQDEGLVYLSPTRYEHINQLGKYTFAEQEAQLSKGLRQRTGIRSDGDTLASFCPPL